MFGWAVEEEEVECMENISGFSHFNYFWHCPMSYGESLKGLRKQIFLLGWWDIFAFQKSHPGHRIEMRLDESWERRGNHPLSTQKCKGMKKSGGTLKIQPRAGLHCILWEQRDPGTQSNTPEAACSLRAPRPPRANVKQKQWERLLCCVDVAIEGKMELRQRKCKLRLCW